MRTCPETTFLVAGVLIIGALLSGSCDSHTETAGRTRASAHGQRKDRADTLAPSISDVSVYEIVRGRPENSGLGQIFIMISATDDRTPLENLEYRLVSIGGRFPQGFISPTGSIYSQEYSADGQELEMITLKWNDGSSDIQDAFDFQLMLYAVDRSGNTSPPSDTIRVAHSGRYIDILFDFGVGAKNRLDTARGIFIKDMVMDPPLTLDLTLTKKEREEVLARAKEIGFFDLPRVVRPRIPYSAVTPCGSYHLKIRAGNKTHEVSWNGCVGWKNDPLMDSLNEIRLMILKMIMSKEAYKRSPEPRGFYL